MNTQSITRNNPTLLDALEKTYKKSVGLPEPYDLVSSVSGIRTCFLLAQHLKHHLETTYFKSFNPTLCVGDYGLRPPTSSRDYFAIVGRQAPPDEAPYYASWVRLADSTIIDPSSVLHLYADEARNRQSSAPDRLLNLPEAMRRMMMSICIVEADHPQKKRVNSYAEFMADTDACYFFEEKPELLAKLKSQFN